MIIYMQKSLFPEQQKTGTDNSQTVHSGLTDILIKFQNLQRFSLTLFKKFIFLLQSADLGKSTQHRHLMLPSHNALAHKYDYP